MNQCARLSLYFVGVFIILQHNRYSAMIYGQTTQAGYVSETNPTLTQLKNEHTIKSVPLRNTIIRPTPTIWSKPGASTLGNVRRIPYTFTTPSSNDASVLNSANHDLDFASLTAEDVRNLTLSCPDNGRLSKDPRHLLAYHKCINPSLYNTYKMKYWLISECPANIQDRTVQATCETLDRNNLASITPVFSAETGLHYRNIYCSMCHGVSELSSWRMGMHRTSIIPLLSPEEVTRHWAKLISINTKVYFVPDITAVTCDGPVNVISTCPEHVTNDNCTESPHIAYVATDLIPSVIFKNAECYACSTIGKNLEIDYVSCLGRKYPCGSKCYERPMAMRVLLSFNDMLCGESRTYDSSVNRCVDIQPISRVRTGSQLGLPHHIAWSVTMSIYDYIPDIEMRPEDILLVELTESRFKKYIEDTMRESYESILHSDMAFDISVKLSTDMMKSYHKAKRLNATSVSPPLLVEASISMFPRDIDGEFALHTEVDRLVDKLRRSPWFMSIHRHFNVTTLPKGVKTSDMSGVNERSHLVAVSFMEGNASGGCNWSVTDEMTVETSTSMPAGHAEVCAFTLSYKDQTAGIVTYVCMSLSCVGLAIVLSIYGAISTLRTFFSSLTMNLAACLLLAQLLFMTGIEMTVNRIACRAISMILHYLWLCAVFWMNASGFHMFRMFRTLESALQVTRGARHYRLSLYVIYCYITPALIVVVGVSIDFALFDQTGYGVHYCFINHRILLAYTFALPIGWVIASNIVFLTCSMRTIQSLKPSDQSGVVVARSSALLCAKLTSVLGLTWSVGFLATWTGLTPLWYVFDVVNGLQGLVIFVTYVLTKRVLANVYACVLAMLRNIPSPTRIVM